MTTTLVSELLLLCWDDRRGRPRDRSGLLPIVLAGATLMDLAAGGHVQVDARGRVTVGNDVPADPAHAWVWTRLRDRRRPRTLRVWIRRLGTAGLRRRLVEALVAAGDLQPRADAASRWRASGHVLADRARGDDRRMRLLAQLDGPADGLTVADRQLLGRLALSGELDRWVPRGLRRTARDHARALAGDTLGLDATSAVAREVRTAVLGALAVGGAAGTH